MDTSAGIDVAALVARLENLETAEAAREAVYRYVEGLDARDWALVESSLDGDAVMATPEGDLVGRAAIVDSLRVALAAGFVPCHQITNARVEVTGPGRATVTSKIQYVLDGGGADAVGWGEYRDEVQVVDGLGRIVRKGFTPVRHLAGSAAMLSARLELLETAEAARAAVYRYATAVDTLDFDLLAQCFTADAVLTTRRGPRNGRDEILDYYRAALADPVDRRHFLCNPTVTVTGPDEAVVASYFLYTFAGAETSVLGWGTYEDRVSVVDGVGYLTGKTIGIGAHADSRVGWATDPTEGTP